MNYLKSLLPFVGTGVLALTFFSCADSRIPNSGTPQAVPQPQNGNSVVYGTVRTLGNNCRPANLIVLRALTDSRTQAPGTEVFVGTFNANDNYQAPLPAGSYVLIAESGSCRFTRTVEVSAGQSLSLDLVLQ